jgi:hypothetical protein
VATQQGFSTVAEIIYFPASQLLEYKGFNYHLLTELIQFLENHNSARLLKQV